MSKFFLSILSILIFLTSSPLVFAQERVFNCQDRYVTLVNPVRGRDLWLDKSLKHLTDQYSLIKDRNLSATWLLQYDVFLDKALIGEINKFDSKQEKGLFLEVSQSLADDARVIYPVNTPWFSPNAVFLSGYSQGERVKLINTLFKKFKSEYGSYPKSIGAWWIDSFSLNYMVEKYGVRSALIVANQRTTDGYGVWGHWWGVSYYPSRSNILAPASNLENKQDVLVIQWAQRDLTRAYGEGPNASNYSLQANDYIKQGEDTSYFVGLAKSYLDCSNSVGQVTVGLETGIESIGYIDEYENQLESLSAMQDLKFLSMNDFYEAYRRVYPDFPKEITLLDDTSSWTLNTDKRTNKYLKDSVDYNQNIAFADFFVEDDKNFLDRKLPVQNDDRVLEYSPLVVLFLFLAAFLTFKRVKKLDVWFASLFFIIASFGPLLISYHKFGWLIFYGQVVSNLLFFQFLVILLSFLFFYIVNKKFDVKALFFIPLSFGCDFLLNLPRYIQLENKHYFGVSLDALRFLGISISKNEVSFVNRDLLSYQAESLLRFNFAKVWDNFFLAFIVYPLIHILLGIFLYIIYRKLNSGFRRIFLAILVILYLGWIVFILNLEPRAVKQF